MPAWTAKAGTPTREADFLNGQVIRLSGLGAGNFDGAGALPAPAAGQPDLRPRAGLVRFVSVTRAAAAGTLLTLRDAPTFGGTSNGDLTVDLTVLGTVLLYWGYETGLSFSINQAPGNLDGVICFSG